MGCSLKRFSLKLEVYPGIPDISARKPEKTRVLLATMPTAYPVGTCANCEKPNRVLKYARRTMCWTYACQQAAHQAVLERKAHRGGTGEHTEMAAPTFCYKILSVHGQRDVDPAVLVGAKRRNKLSASDTTVGYLVYGEFGEHERDVGFKDTRWVELTDLLNLKAADTKKLVAYEKELAQRMAEKRQKLIDAAEEEDDDEDGADS